VCGEVYTLLVHHINYNVLLCKFVIRACLHPLENFYTPQSQIHRNNPAAPGHRDSPDSLPVGETDVKHFILLLSSRVIVRSFFYSAVRIHLSK